MLLYLNSRSGCTPVSVPRCCARGEGARSIWLRGSRAEKAVRRLAVAFALLGLCLRLDAADGVLVRHADLWRFHKGTNAPQSSWQTVADDALDGTWESAP